MPQRTSRAPGRWIRMANCPHPYDLQSFIDGAVGGDEFARVREHVTSCPECGARVGELERLRCLLRARRVEAPAGLLERILELVKTAIPVRRLGCREAREMTSAYLDEELNELGRETLEAHLFACDECYREYVTMRTAARAMRATPRVPVSGDLKDRILAAVTADSAEPEPALGRIALRGGKNTLP